MSDFIRRLGVVQFNDRYLRSALRNIEKKSGKESESWTMIIGGASVILRVRFSDNSHVDVRIHDFSDMSIQFGSICEDSMISAMGASLPEPEAATSA